MRQLLFVPFLALAVAALSVAAPTAQSTDPLPRKPAFGAQLAPVPPAQRSELKIPDGQGLLLVSVLPGLTAEKSGLLKDDILLTLDGTPIQAPGQLGAKIATLKAGQTVNAEILRGGKKQTVRVTFTERQRWTSPDYDVIYGHVMSNGKRIRTIWTRPKGTGKFPALMIIQGLGPAVMDQPLTGAAGYGDILRPFAKTFVTLRVEKPGVGDSEGGPYSANDFETEADVYRQALLELKRTPFVDADNVFIFGHSMGGSFGPKIVAEIPVRGLAVYGTLAKTWGEYAYENTRRQALLAGQSYGEISAALRLQARFQDKVFEENMSPEDVAKRYPELAEIASQSAPGGLLFGANPNFFRQLNAFNAAAAWEKVDAHVLAMWGATEFISGEDCHQLIADIVNKANPGKGRYARIENADHAFRQTASVVDSHRTWGQPGTFNPAVVDVLQKWIEEIRKR